MQTTRTGTESQKWRSHGMLSVGRGRGENEEKVQGIRSINGRYKIDREVKNSMGNGKAKELICMTHGHELRGKCGWEGLCMAEENKGGKMGQCNSIMNKYI